MLNSVIGTSLTTGSLLICTAASVVLGFFTALGSTYKSQSSKSVFTTIAIMPVIVQIVMMVVNGNIGTGIAVAGAFTLVRFRTIPGKARDILFMFTAMGIGMACGTGYIAVAALLAVLVILLNVIYLKSKFADDRICQRYLRITIPEDLNYTHEFDEIFAKYTTRCEFQGVRTTNMGSLFRVAWDIDLANSDCEKDFIDELRTLNGNLEICCNISVPEREL
ncbi:MAG: DUF4956 domain-containing protein [Clostridiales bacterium]|nr:DUF4956 domain-containing protein [Clostridiales bacterium]